MKKLLLIFLLFRFTGTLSAQFTERILPGYKKWPDGQNGFSILKLSGTNIPFDWPSELKGLKYISLYDIPFELDPSVLVGSGTEETRTLQFPLPGLAKEVLLLIYADFPDMEKTGFESNLMPLDVLDQPERMVFELKYSDGSLDQLIPVNSEKQIYGITRGRGLYSLKAPNGKSISEITFHDKMTNASFLFAGVTVNSKQPRFADPPVQSAWYPMVSKVSKSDVEFSFGTKKGLSWNKIKSAMLPETIDLTKSPVFRIVIADEEIPSTSFNVVSEEKTADHEVYSLIYQKANVKLAARLMADKPSADQVQMTLDVTNKSDQNVVGTLYFPVVEGISIGSVDQTWYAYARDGLVLNRVPCNWRDYLGSEKPMQYDGIFNPSKGVGIAFLPRDTTDMFRWYNFAKDGQGVNYSLEFPALEVKPGENFKSITWAMEVVPGDWKDQFKVYQNWLATWYKPYVPRLPWFQHVFAFVVENAYEFKQPDMVAHAKAYKERWGSLDYFHVWGWTYQGTMKSGQWWGDYSNFDNVGGKKQFQETVKTFQDVLKVPFGPYVDAYLMSVNSTDIADSLQQKWSIKGPDGLPIDTYQSFAACPYVKGWRDYLKNVYLRLEKDFGFKGIYNDETGMNLRTRACYDKNHGHPVPYYQAGAERQMLKELKSALPTVAIYSELGATDVLCQYCDGSFGYTTFWGGVTPRGWGNFDAHPSYNVVAPHYLHIRRFACPDFKTFELNMFDCPWRNGNWYLLKFPFFNGLTYYHRWDEGTNADREAIDQYRKIRSLQEKYKNEFSSMDVEPLLRTEMNDLFVNRFSTPRNDVYTVYNAGFRSAKGRLIILDKTGGSVFTDEWTGNKLSVIDLPENKVGIWLEIGPRSVGCFAREKAL